MTDDATEVREARHLPGLEALRAVAVAVVVGFHLEVPHVGGGFLGVSLFFTLSGFLITRNLLLERERSGTIRLGRFWARRARRLLPAAWATILVTSVWALFAARQSGLRPGDALAALFSVSNWQFLAAGNSYAAVFQSPSPLLHFWSLAVEEQAYLLLPLLVAFVAGRRRIALGAAAALLAATSFALPVVFEMSVDRTYYGTDTRIGEILVGVLLAVVLTGRELHWQRARVLVGVPALVLFLLACSRITNGDPFVADGMLPMVAGLSCLLVAAGSAPSGWLAAAGRWAPVALIGRASYGIYLFHWPVIVALRGLGIYTSRVLVAAVVVAVVCAAAVVSLRWLEMPIRSAHWSPRRMGVAGGAVMVAVVAIALLAPPRLSPGTDLVVSLEDAAASLEPPPSVPQRSPRPAPDEPGVAQELETDVTGSTSGDGTAPAADRPPSMRFFGDSVMLSLALATPSDLGIEVVTVRDDQLLGCGIAPFVEPADAGPIVSCGDPTDDWQRSMAAHPVDAAVVWSCQWETVSRRVPGVDGWLTIGDLPFDDHVRAAYTLAIDRLIAGGAERVLWVRCPQPGAVTGSEALVERLAESRDPARVDALNRIVEEVVAARPEVACTVDFDSWVDAHRDDLAIRPDGSHFEWRSPTGAGEAFVDVLLRAWHRCTAPNPD